MKQFENIRYRRSDVIDSFYQNYKNRWLVIIFHPLLFILNIRGDLKDHCVLLPFEI